MKLHYPVLEKHSTIGIDGKSKVGGKTGLVVVLHGILGACRKTGALADATFEEEPESDVWIPKLPIRHFWRCDAPEVLVQTLKEDLDLIWATGRYEYLKLVGHSMGGILARALLVLGRQEYREYRANSSASLASGHLYWAHPGRSRDRLVLIAPVNRGVGISRHMGPARVLATALFLTFGALMGLLSLRPTIMGALRGAPFLTRMRLGWLESHFEQPMPLTVQLLGSTDDLVSPEDNIDSPTGKDFRYLDVPHSGHLNVIHLGFDEDRDNWSQEVKDRRRIFQRALCASSEELAREEVRPWELRPLSESECERRRHISHVVFVIHGIRDVGHWTDKVARRVWKLSRDAQPPSPGAPQDTVEKVTDSYGYFGMGPFLLPFLRWKKVAWFMERYLEARAAYPAAKFCCIAHSHGTYIITRALETYDQCRFENLVFAGSVVRENYEWRERVANGQITGRVLNMVATADWVVAIFPRLFQLYNLQDLGGAGHNGFQQNERGAGDNKVDRVSTIRFVRGSHGAGNAEDFWDLIAKFLLGNYPAAAASTPANAVAQERFSPPRTLWTAGLWLLSWLNIFIWTAIVAAVLIGAPLMINSLSSHIPGALQWVKDIPTDPARAIPAAAIGLVLYVRLSWSQRRYNRRFWMLRNFLGFPLALAASVSAIWFLVNTGAAALGVPLAPPAGAEILSLDNGWSSAAITLWFVFVLWALRRI